MKIKYIFILCTGIVATSSCGGKKELKTEKLPYEKLKGLNWMIGSWESRNEEGVMTESWSQLNDSVFAGVSHYIEGKDTIFYEQIKLEQRGGDIFYVPVIKDQNDGKPTEFKLTYTEGQKAKFENPAHDFPQIVSYELKGDSMFAEISGKLNGEDHSEKFPMVKAK